MNIFHKEKFKGDEKVLIHLLAPYEPKFIAAVLPHVPRKIGTVHLTLMTIIWSSSIILAGYFAKNDIRWLWLFSSCILFQYITDMLDGAVGRMRNSGFIKWGFYMDHFLDYVFLFSIVIGYTWLLPESYWILSVFCLAFCAGFMVHTLMDFSITNNFKISCSLFGVSEARIVLIIFNTILIVVGKGLLIQIFPFFVGMAFVALCTVVYKSQKIYAHLDVIQQSTQEQNTSKNGGNVCEKPIMQNV